MAVTIIVGVNSWVTLAEADAFIEGQFGSSWSALTITQRQQCLITAFWWLYNSSQYNITKTSTNENVKNAQMLLADWIGEFFEDWKERNALWSSGVKSFSLSKWRETLQKTEIPENIKDILFTFATGEHFFNISRTID